MGTKGKRLGFTAVACAVVLIMPVGVVTGAPLYEDGFDSDSSGSYSVISSGDSLVQFGFDYSVHGIPAAPGAVSTLGLKLQAHLQNTIAVHAVTLATNATFDAAAPGYRVKFHAWQNFRLGGGGSTHYVSAGVGHDGLTNNFSGNPGPTGPTPDTGAGAWFDATGDNGAANDFIAFKDGLAQGVTPAPSPYFAPHDPLFPAQSGNISYYTAAFPSTALGSINGGALSALQGQTGSTVPGALGFAWRLWQIDVVENVATWSIDGLPIAQLVSGVNGTMPTSGRVSIGYLDPFNSASAFPDLQFAIIDNLSIDVLPEPAVMSLIILGCFVLQARQRSGGAGSR